MQWAPSSEPMLMLRVNPDEWRLNGEKQAGTRVGRDVVHALMVARLAPAVAAAKAFFEADAPLEMARIVKVAFDLGLKTTRLQAEEARLEAGLAAAAAAAAAAGP
jgi:hypothetical protein